MPEDNKMYVISVNEADTGKAITAIQTRTFFITADSIDEEEYVHGVVFSIGKKSKLVNLLNTAVTQLSLQLELASWYVPGQGLPVFGPVRQNKKT